MAITTDGLLLAIESAIGGGSIALFSNERKIDGFVGPAGVSRAEDLIPNIDQLLKRSGFDKSDLTNIVVSVGPGSFTGIRIGIATAMGLAAALPVVLRKLSMLDAVAVTEKCFGEFTVVLPVGRDTVCAQTFVRSDETLTSVKPPHPLTFDELIVLIDTGAAVVVDASIFAAIQHNLRDRVLNIREDLATRLGRAALAHNIAETSAPLFVGKKK